MPQRPDHRQYHLSRRQQQEQENAFSNWELPGRGWAIADGTIDPEPPLRSMSYGPALTSPVDDARVPSLVGRLFTNRLVPEPLPITERQASPDMHRPRLHPPVAIETFRLVVPSELEIPFEQTEQVLSNLANTAAFISFETLGTSDSITFQIACPASESNVISALLRNHLPAVTFQQGEDAVKEQIRPATPGRIGLPLLADFGLGREWFKPLPAGGSFPTDPFLPLIAALDEITDGETLCFQVLLRRTRQNWNGSAHNVIFDENGKPRFAELQNILPAIKEKLSRPLFAVNVRLLVQAASDKRSQQIVRQINPFFRQFSSTACNELIPLRNDGFAAGKHLQSFLDRTTYRYGAILSAPEISGLFHLPTDAIRSAKIQRSGNRTKAAPEFATKGSLVLGINEHCGHRRKIALSPQQRIKHMHLIGATGSGKTNLILGAIEQDLEAKNGLFLLDFHGDLVDKVVERIPESRLNDVIYFDPSDEEFPIGFNILSAHSELEKTLLSSDLIAIFRRFSTSWGDQMNSVLANAILAFLESTRGGNLLDLKRFLIEKEFRDEFMRSVEDNEICYYWKNEFPELKGKPYASLLTRLDTFLRSKLIRFIVAQNDNRLNFRQIMDEKKILLIRLSLGAIGEENAHLLGSLIVSKLHQAVLSRQELAEDSRNPFFAYIDEASYVVTPTLNQVLSGGRAFKFGLALSHQQLSQFRTSDADILSSVLSNSYTRICFRLDDVDAERMSRGFSFFTAEHLKDLGVGEAICRFEQSRFDFNLKTAPIEAVPEDLSRERRKAVIEHSRRTYAKPKAVVAEELKRNRAEKPLTRTQPENVVVLPPLKMPMPKTAKEGPERPNAFEKQNTVSEKHPLSEVTILTPDTPLPGRAIENVSDRGSQQHRYLQSLVKRMAENHGFRVTIEKPVFGGIGRIDVALENNEFRIACEIAHTNTVDYELQNLQKCLASGFDRVVIVSTDTKHLDNIKKRVELTIPDDILPRVSFVEMENFYLFLETLPKLGSKELDSPPTRVKGYDVNMSFRQASESESKVKEKVVLDIISDVLRRNGGGSND